MRRTQRHTHVVRRTMGVLSVCATVLGAAACGGATAGSAAGGGSFSVGVPTSYIEHFLPGQAGDSGLAEAIWTPLTTLDVHTGKVVDAVAQSFETTDQQHWTIRLKPNWTFQNGEPVTARSFADSWNATAYGPNAMTSNYLFTIIQGYAALNPATGKPTADTLSGVTVVGTDTLHVTLTAPLSTFPYILSGTAFAPMPTEAMGHFDTFDKLPIGDGPYRVAAPGIAQGAQQLNLERYNGYAGTKGRASSITVKAYQNETTEFTSFQAGAVDIATVTGNDLTTANGSYRSQLVTAAAPAVVYLGFPLWDKRFTDPRVREAFSLAIDRGAIIKALLGGFAEPAAGVAPHTIAGGGGSDCGDCTYDPARARTLLAAAGGWSGALALWTKQDSTMQTVLQAVLDQLRTNLGITSITLQSQPLSQIYSSLSAHKVDGPFLLYQGASYPSLYSLVDELFSADSASNVTGYRSAAVARQMAAAAGSSSPGQASAMVQQASRTALAELPLAPLYYPVTGLVHAKNLSNVAIDYLADADLASVTAN